MTRLRGWLTVWAVAVGACVAAGAGRLAGPVRLDGEALTGYGARAQAPGGVTVIATLGQSGWVHTVGADRVVVESGVWSSEAASRAAGKGSMVLFH
jgi:hypothetical protein